MAWGTAGVIHAFLGEAVGQVAGDVAGAIVAEPPGPMRNRGTVAARGDQGILQRGGHVRCLHRRAQPPGDDVAAVIIEDRRQVEPAPAVSRQANAEHSAERPTTLK